MKDIYCLKEIKQINISDDIEELFIELFKTENIKNIFKFNLRKNKNI